MPLRSPERVAARYDRLAPVYRVVEVAFGLPPGIRRRAVERMALSPGGTAVEIGCGTGRNLEHLARAVGPGTVLGIEVSPGMLRRAEALRSGKGWSGVELIQHDATVAPLPDDVDGVLFGLSYSVLPDRIGTLARAWRHLKPGGRLVILDAAVPPGRLGRVLRPAMHALSRLTVLGDPESRPWDELHSVAGDVRVERFLFGTYVICTAVKPAAQAR